MKGDIRADVVIENMPDFTTSGFHVVLGEGLKFSTSSEGDEYDTLNNNYTSSFNKVRDQEIVFATTNAKAKNYNGHFVGFYVERTAINNIFNSTANIEFRYETNLSDMIVDDENHITIYNPLKDIGSMNALEMLESHEYRVGEVSGDGRIDGSDASHVLRQIELYGTVKISDINGNYNDAITDLRSAYAADVNKDGYISRADADMILRYYTEIISGGNYDGNIGKVEIYEIYND